METKPDNGGTGYIDRGANDHREGEVNPDENDQQRDRPHRVDIEAEYEVDGASAISPQRTDNDADHEAEQH